MSGGILVTGATGFIGHYVVRQLLADGRDVRAFVRSATRLDPGIRQRLKVARGDIRDRYAVDAAVEGCDTVLHLAAVARAWSPDPNLFVDTNERGVEHLLDAARRHDLARLVHVSTQLTVGAPEGRSRPGATIYERSKLAGERLVEAYAREGRHAVIVHPTRVYGPGPLTDANGVTKMIDLYLRGRFRFRIADDGARANYVHAADVARGIARAAELGATGRHYVLGGEENLTLAAFLDQVSELAGRQRWTLALPRSAARGIGSAGEWWGRATGETSLTRAWVEVFLRDMPFDIGPARRELGYAPRPLERGLRQTLAWLETAGQEAA